MQFWLLLVLVLPALGLPSSPFYGASDNSVPLPPSKDPWYTAPPDFEHSSPGAILRLRRAPGNLSEITGNCSAAYNILYRATNSRYQPSWAVTTLFVPSKPSLSSKALLSYQVPYNTIDVDGSPSYLLYGAPIPDISNALGRGWFVTVPDFEGPLAANVAGIQEGHATIDSLRATVSSNLGLAHDAKIVLWGYSGGSIASEWALELQEQYAPELKIDGAALGGLVSNNTRCIDTVEKTPLAYIAVGAMLGPLIEYPEAYDRLVSQLKTSGPYNKTGFLAAKHLTATQGFSVYENQSIYDYFINGSAVLHDPLIRQVLMENQFMTYHESLDLPYISTKLFTMRLLQSKIPTTTSTAIACSWPIFYTNGILLEAIWMKRPTAPHGLWLGWRVFSMGRTLRGIRHPVVLSAM